MPSLQLDPLLIRANEIFEENSEIFGLDLNKLAQGKAIGRILEKLLVGLVPVRGYATDYEVVEIEGKECIVHHKLSNELPETELLSKRPLYVVGVAEESLFWKDVRRILFSKARFRVLCRLAQDGVQDSWTPVKLAHILSLVVPNFDNQTNTLWSNILASMAKASKAGQNVDRKPQLMHDALISYATLLAEHYGHTITVQDLSDVNLLSEQQCNSFGSIKERREAFNSIATFLLDRFGLERDAQIIAQYRTDALVEAGMDFSGQPMPLVVSANVPSANVPSEERFLDTEFIAIYW